MVDVFISYSSHDEVTVAQRARVIEADSYKVWRNAEPIRQAEARFGG